MRNATKRKLLEHDRRGPVHGEKHPATKLTEEEVLEIVEAAESGEYSKMSIARSFGISATHVRHIIGGKSWSWLTGIKPTQNARG